MKSKRKRQSPKGKRIASKEHPKTVGRKVSKIVRWTTPDVTAILQRVNAGSISPEAAADHLGTKPYYVKVRAGWLREHGSAAEPEGRGRGKGKRKK
jgi:hypothetical protein